jgi:hypothetical protein
MNVLLDCSGRVMYMLGENTDSFNLAAVLPPGTEAFPLEKSVSGHLLLPISDYENASKSETSTTASVVAMLSNTNAAASSAASNL